MVQFSRARPGATLTTCQSPSALPLATGSRGDNRFEKPLFLSFPISSEHLPTCLQPKQKLPVSDTSCGSLAAQKRASFGHGEQVAEPEGSLTFRVGHQPGLWTGQSPWPGATKAQCCPRCETPRLWGLSLKVSTALCWQSYKNWQACAGLCPEALQPPAHCTLLTWLWIKSCPLCMTCLLPSLPSLLPLTPLLSSLANAVG